MSGLQITMISYHPDPTNSKAIQDHMRFTPLQNRTWNILESRRGRPGFDELFREEQEVIALFWLEGEVLNGSFHQYFTNSSGDLAPLAVSGLRRIGATKTLRILESAMDKLCTGDYPTDRDERWDLLEALGEETEIFDADSSALCELPEKFREMSLDRLAANYDLHDYDLNATT
jgi:hypothetical protein